MKMVVMSVVMALAFSSTLLAGGGSKNNTGTVRVTNNTGSTAVVSVGGTQAAINTALANPTPANLTAAKAQIIAAGATGVYTKVAAGTVVVQGVTIDANNAVTAQLNPTNVTVTKGGTKTVTLSGTTTPLILASANRNREMTFATIAMVGLCMMGGVGMMIGRKE